MTVNELIEKLKKIKRQNGGHIDVLYLIDSESGFECGIYEVTAKLPDQTSIAVRAVLA